ncbi:MAG: hypothetical protein IJ538_05175 [Clostridia bacterium]|nr:hypothetical protein [Clostridia bacterium]
MKILEVRYQNKAKNSLRASKKATPNQIVKMILLMACSGIGAGFISGAEIFQYFSKFGNNFFVVLMLFCVTYFLVLLKIFKIKIFKPKKFKMYKNNFLKLKNTFKTKNRIKSFLIFLNLSIISGTMFSGLKNVLKELFFNNYLIFSLIALILIIVCTAVGINLLSKLTGLVFVFVLIFSIYLFGLNFEVNQVSHTLKNSVIAAGFSGVVYFFMNVLQLKSIYNSMGVNLTKKQGIFVAVIIPLVLSFVIYSFSKFLLNHLALTSLNMPIFSYFKVKGGVVFGVYVSMFLLAIFSALITALIGLKDIFNKKLNQKFMSSFLAVIVALIISFINFKTLIVWLYPVVAMINFVIFVFL